MQLSRKTVRRLIQGAILGAALLMLTAGLTVLQGRLSVRAYSWYWMICLGLTALVIIIAFIDAAAVQRDARVERKELLAETIRQIQDEAVARKKNGLGS